MLAPSIATANFKNEVEIDLAVGSTVSLEVFGFLGTIVLLSNAAGAALMIIRLR